MKTYTIRPLRVGTIWRKKENMTYQSGETQIAAFPLISYYLENEDHKIIVDTGGTVPDGKKWAPYTRSQEENLDQALKNIGVSPQEIDLVIFTHLHWDHASNNHLFPNARFIAQKKEYEYLVSPEPKVKVGYETDLVLQTNYEFIDGDQEIVDGISVVLAPGHCTGMQCVVVETTEGKYIIVGDLIPVYANWEAVPHQANGCHDDLNAMMDSLGKIDKLHGRILPGHDEKVFAQKIYP